MVFSWRNKPGEAVEASERSSTASHLSEDYATAGVGEAADEFYGIPLSTDFSELTPYAIAGLALLLLLLLLKPHIKVLRNPIASSVFWILVLYGAFEIKEIALYPLVSTIILTRTSYPYLVVIPHCIAAVAAYRKERSSSVHYLPAFGLGFMCYGFGGSIVSDVLMGLPVTALGHARILPCYLLSWILVWFSPFDIVYKLSTDKRSFFYYFLNACEAVDAVTTPMGRVSRGARELKNKSLPPIMAGLLAGAAGSVIRYGERVVVRNGGELVAQESFKAIEAGVWRNLGYSVLWWYIAVYQCYSGANKGLETSHSHEYNGNNTHRLVIVAAHVVWNLACDLGLASGHPVVFIRRKFRAAGAKIAARLHCGPQEAPKGVKTENTE
jgi:hypothetical protein